MVWYTAGPGVRKLLTYILPSEATQCSVADPDMDPDPQESA